MSKILLITEEPNIQASKLNHDDLFDISKNSFSQFLGRLLLGDETSYRKFFNSSNFTWMHAKGSTCHGSENQDGKHAIYGQVSTQNYHLIITFGAPAMKIFLKDEFANFKKVLSIMKNGPVKISSLADCIDRRKISISRGGFRDSYLVCFPHPSGQAQVMWMKYAEDLSNCLIKTQSIISEIIR